MLLTVDIGTSNFKSAIYDFDGKRLKFASCPLSPVPCPSWIQAFAYCMEKLGYLKDVQAVIISGNGPTLVPVLDDSSAGKIRPWSDRGAEKYQKEVSAVMGGFVDAAFFLPKIMRIKNEEIDLYKKVKHFLGCPEYLAYVLTGEAKSVFPSDGFDRWFWNEKALKELQLAPAKFPPFIRPGEVFGKLTPPVSEKYGFKKGIPVISGGPDFFAAILGAGVTEPGMTCNRTGTSDGINHCTENHIKHDFLMSYAHPVKPFWNLSGIIKSTGREIEMSREPVEKTMENICLEINKVIKQIESTGEKVSQLRVTGGMAGNEQLNQLKADITGKQIIQLECKEAELLGNAIIGLCCFGKNDSYKEAASELVKVERVYNPSVQ